MINDPNPTFALNAAPAPSRGGAGPAAGPSEPSVWTPNARPWAATALVGLLAAAGVAAVLNAWNLPPFANGIEVTENAYVHGLTTVISPQVSGYVTGVTVTDYDRVKAGSPLVQIDNRIYRQKVAQAQATLDAQLAALANNTQAHAAAVAGLAAKTAAVADARAHMELVQSDYARADTLVRNGTISHQAFEQNETAVKQAQAGIDQAVAAVNIATQEIRTVEVARDGLVAAVEAARATLGLAQIDLDNTTIVAPREGRVGEVGVRLGQYVTNGTQLMSLVPDARWVIADYKEGQTTGMAPGQSVELTVDALGGAHLRGHVQRLAPATGSEFAVIKADNGTGNFIKIAQRIGVRITIDPNQSLASRLSPGMSVETRVDTRSGG